MVDTGEELNSRHKTIVMNITAFVANGRFRAYTACAEGYNWVLLHAKVESKLSIKGE
mgnify:CR=1 FL=1